MIEYQAESIKTLVESAQRFWANCVQDQLQPLHDPLNCPEYSVFNERLREVSIDDFIGNPEFKARIFVTSGVEYLDVYKDEKIHIMAMFMQPKVMYPIHDHPEMLVASKILKGQAEIRHFDIIDKKSFYQKIDSLSTAKLTAREAYCRELKESDIDLILPDFGNLHSIFSVQRTVVLDVMFNYYDDLKRPCSLFVLGPSKEDGIFDMYYQNKDI